MQMITVQVFKLSDPEVIVHEHIVDFDIRKKRHWVTRLVTWAVCHHHGVEITQFVKDEQP